MQNGVDADFFSPAHAGESPYAAGGPVIVFSGAMDYWPNIDAVTWFATELLPRIRHAVPDVRFCIVGMNPAPAVQALAGEGVTVTGTVPDVRPYIAHADVVVAPLRIARGIQNKVLEALAMGLPALVSTPVHSTFGGESPLGVIHCAGPDDYLAQLLRNDAPERQAIRRATMSRFSWESALRPLEEQLGTLG